MGEGRVPVCLSLIISLTHSLHKYEHTEGVARVISESLWVIIAADAPSDDEPRSNHFKNKTLFVNHPQFFQHIFYVIILFTLELLCSIFKQYRQSSQITQFSAKDYYAAH
jgi:hypothetical protein